MIWIECTTIELLQLDSYHCNMLSKGVLRCHGTLTICNIVSAKRVWYLPFALLSYYPLLMEGKRVTSIDFRQSNACFEPLAILRRAEHLYIVLREGYEIIHGASQ